MTLSVVLHLNNAYFATAFSGVTRECTPNLFLWEMLQVLGTKITRFPSIGGSFFAALQPIDFASLPTFPKYPRLLGRWGTYPVSVTILLQPDRSLKDI